MLSKSDLNIFMWIIITVVILTFINNMLIRRDMLTVSKDRPLKETLTDALYFTTTTFSSVGYGDITPKTANAKIIVAFEQVLLICLSLGAIGYEMINKNPSMIQATDMISPF